MVQTFAVFADDPTTAQIKTVKVLTAQLVMSYGGVVYPSPTGTVLYTSRMIYNVRYDLHVHIHYFIAS